MNNTKTGRIFASRAEFSRRFGIHGASMLPLGSVYGGELPQRARVACLIDGELRETRSGEASHREICTREAVVGSVIVDGFSYEAPL